MAADYRHAPCGLASVDAEGTVLRVNHTFLEWTGDRQERIVGRPFVELLTQGSQVLYASRVATLLRAGSEIRELALALERGAQPTLPVLLNAAAGSAGDGSTIVRIALFDASGRQDHERQLLTARRALARSEDRLLLLQESSETFGEARTAESLTALLAETTRNAFDATASTVMILDPADELLHAVGSTSPLGPTAPASSARPEAKAVRTGSVVSITEVGAAPAAVGEALRAAGLASMTVTPLFDDHQSFGALACFFAEPRELGEEELDLMKALTRQAAQGLLRIRLQEQLRFQAMHDQLTGLANRQLLQYRLTQALSRAARQLQSMAVIFLDLDGFKPINDELGHLVGDAVLEQVSTRLLASVRVSDTAARFGGDEFVVLCEDTDAAAAGAVAERIRTEIRRPLTGAAADFPLTASVGVVVYRPTGGPVPAPKVVLGHADAAMYRSKAAGKDRDTLLEI